MNAPNTLGSRTPTKTNNRIDYLNSFTASLFQSVSSLEGGSKDVGLR